MHDDRFLVNSADCRERTKNQTEMPVQIVRRGLVRLLESTTRLPVTVGVVRPAFLLPVNWRQWNEAKLQAVFAMKWLMSAVPIGCNYPRRTEPCILLVSSRGLDLEASAFGTGRAKLRRCRDRKRQQPHSICALSVGCCQCASHFGRPISGSHPRSCHGARRMSKRVLRPFWM